MYKKIFYNHFELAVAVSATMIVVLAIAMDWIFFLQACPMCILTRYVFLLVAISGFVAFLIKKKVVGHVMILISSILGLVVTSKQIYIQNMPLEDIGMLSGCSMPFHTQVEYFGIIEAVSKTLAGGPSCAEDGWRFILNFAEWGFVFFLTYLLSILLKLKSS
tara:strand:- start:8855 stop:9340 length:486 start_codon:yes stop_codon:yes gene_type:complete